MPAPEPAEPRAEPIPLSIVYEDDAIIVIDKPKGLVVHPAAGNWTGTLVNALIAHCGDSLSGIGGVRRPGIVHRLDKDTTGLLVVAKTDRAHRKLAAQFADHGRTGALERADISRSSGAFQRARKGQSTSRSTATRMPATRWRFVPAGGPLSRIGRSLSAMPGPTKKAWQAWSNAGSRPAAPIRSGSTWPRSATLCWVIRSTARGSKQKRVWLPERARDALAALDRQALHAHILVLEHPVTGELLHFRSELPADLAALRCAMSQPDRVGSVKR